MQSSVLLLCYGPLSASNPLWRGVLLASQGFHSVVLQCDVGAAGYTGKDGVDGKDGKDGKDGPRGPQGLQGALLPICMRTSCSVPAPLAACCLLPAAASLVAVVPRLVAQASKREQPNKHFLRVYAQQLSK
jgi:hypothetical protein